MSEKVIIKHEETVIRPVFGGTKIEPIYHMKHFKNGAANVYKVVCEITGIQDASITLRPQFAEWIAGARGETDMENGTNPETLTAEAALELFESKID